MSIVSFCPCTDSTCEFHPGNHEFGCTLCVEDSLKCGELPKCFFLRAEGSIEGRTDWSFKAFSKLKLE